MAHPVLSRCLASRPEGGLLLLVSAILIDMQHKTLACPRANIVYDMAYPILHAKVARPPHCVAVPTTFCTPPYDGMPWRV